jgi:hypothetical protein
VVGGAAEGEEDRLSEALAGFDVFPERLSDDVVGWFEG